MEERLQKVLARAGYAGRLKCEDLIRQGLVTVNGRVVRELGFKVDPHADKIEVVGEPVAFPDPVCYVFHKPEGVSTGFSEGRRRASDYFVGLDVRLSPVGQMDYETTGLLLMSNDGDLANRLTHPRYAIEKTYLVEAAGPVSHETISEMLRGVWLSDGRARALRIKVIHAARNKTVLEFIVREARDRTIRRMLARFGHAVERIRRVRIGRLVLGTMKPGQYRRLADPEIAALLVPGEETPDGVEPRVSKPRPGGAPEGRPQPRTPRPGGARPAAPRSGSTSPPPQGGPRPSAPRSGSKSPPPQGGSRGGPRPPRPPAPKGGRPSDRGGRRPGPKS